MIDLTPGELLAGNFEQLEIFIISRLPRLLAILCTGIGMSVAGLIMQQLCSNKFVSPTTGATISSAQFGILLALLFMPASTLWSRAIFAFATAILGTWIFVWFIQRIQFKDVVMVPLVGIMFGNVIGGITNYLAYKYEMTQALSSWLVGHFSLVLKGRYEIVWLTVPLVVLAFLFANHFNIVGLGKDFSKNLGVPYNLVLFSGLTIAAMITASSGQASGVLQALQGEGIPVPEQMALACLSDSATCSILEPPLTALESPNKRLGMVAARMLFDTIEDNGEEGYGPQEVILQPKLKIRRSCGNTKPIYELFG